MKATVKDVWQTIKLNAKGWQILLGLALVTFIAVVTVFGIFAIRDYYLQANSNELIQQLKDSKERQVELEKIASESLGAYRENKVQLEITSLKLQTANTLLLNQKPITEKELKNYEEAKKRITVDSNNYTTDELCLRAKQYGIICQQ